MWKFVFFQHARRAFHLYANVLTAVSGRVGIASLNSTAYQTSKMRQEVDSLAHWLGSGFESHQGRGIFFFQTMHRFLVTNFHIHKNM